MSKIIGIDLSPQDKDFIEQISQIRAKGNFQTMRKKFGTDKLTEFLKKLYPRYNITEIERLMDVSDSTLLHWFKRLKIKSVRRHSTNRADAGDENNEKIEEQNMSVQKKSTIKITPELAYVIGFALGDGAIQKYAVEVFNKDEKLKPELLNFLKPFGTVSEKTRDDGLWKIRLSSVLIANLIKDKTGIRKDTIEYILKNDSLAKKFIAAFWDAEGSVLRQKNYFHINLNNSNKYLLDEIMHFLKNHNIDCTIIEIKARERTYFLKGREVVAKKKLYRLNVLKKSFILWANEIGLHLLHSKKSKMVNEILEGGK